MPPTDLVIRAFEPADWPGVADLWAQPLVQRNTLQLPLQSRDAARRRIESVPEGRQRLLALRGELVVGLASVQPNPRWRQRHVGDIGLMVHDAHHRQGIGSALLAALLELADQWLGLARLQLTVYADNAAALALYQKFGFEIEGMLRWHALRDGAYVDSCSMARLRPSPVGGPDAPDATPRRI